MDRFELVPRVFPDGVEKGRASKSVVAALTTAALLTIACNRSEHRSAFLADDFLPAGAKAIKLLDSRDGFHGDGTVAWKITMPSTAVNGFEQHLIDSFQFNSVKAQARAVEATLECVRKSLPQAYKEVHDDIGAEKVELLIPRNLDENSPWPLYYLVLVLRNSGTVYVFSYSA